MLTKDTFKSIDTIINRCKEIETNNVNSESKYKELINIIISNLYNNDKSLNKGLVEIINDKENLHSLYQYAIGTLIYKAHKNSPDYVGRNERVISIKEFIEFNKARVLSLFHLP